MDWRFKTSENGITLHDHEITEWIFGEDDITLVFEEVLDFKRLPDSVILECDAWNRKGGKDSGFCEVEFSCEEVLFCWNKFTSDAWFQDWSK